MIRLWVRCVFINTQALFARRLYILFSWIRYVDCAGLVIAALTPHHPHVDVHQTRFRSVRVQVSSLFLSMQHPTLAPSCNCAPEARSLNPLWGVNFVCPCSRFIPPRVCAMSLVEIILKIHVFHAFSPALAQALAQTYVTCLCQVSLCCVARFCWVSSIASLWCVVFSAFVVFLMLLLWSCGGGAVFCPRGVTLVVLL